MGYRHLIRRLIIIVNIYSLDQSEITMSVVMTVDISMTITTASVVTEEKKLSKLARVILRNYVFFPMHQLAYCHIKCKLAL